MWLWELLDVPSLRKRTNLVWDNESWIKSDAYTIMFSLAFNRNWKSDRTSLRCYCPSIQTADDAAWNAFIIVRKLPFPCTDICFCHERKTSPESIENKKLASEKKVRVHHKRRGSFSRFPDCSALTVFVKVNNLRDVVRRRRSSRQFLQSTLNLTVVRIVAWHWVWWEGRWERLSSKIRREVLSS